ncbi:MAG TPA: enoyl-CoA hydratase-related protein [Actinomycetota bacterium]|nr:enoyl-CoA hydratase-related protein [Actinomycetota bacterium]
MSEAAVSPGVVNLTVDVRGVARLELNRPEVRNALDGDLMSALAEAASGLPDHARVLVISGAGPVFCAGADLKWMASVAGSTDPSAGDSSRLSRLFDALDSCPVPVIARVHGAAMAGAAGIVACADVAVAARSTKFAFTEVRLGLVPAVISPYVVRKVGYAFARAAFMSGEPFDAERACEAGLVHRAVDESELDEVVESYVRLFLAAAPGAVRRTRRLVDEVIGRTPAEVRDLTVRTIAEARAGEEAQEGIKAFFEKRPPRWAAPGGPA